MDEAVSPVAPRAFLCHATEDKDRFVRGFASRLRDRGVNVWFDEWELLPGDSLVDRIFEQGLKDADVFIPVLSKVSVTKRWVREELNAGLIQKIEGNCKLIPVVIEDCEIPVALRNLVQVRIADLESYDDDFDRIVRAIFDDRSEQLIGKPPAYSALPSIPGLQASDTLILQKAGDMALKSDSELIDSREVLEAVSDQDITEKALIESLLVLEGEGYIKISKTLGSGLPSMAHFLFTNYGFEEYLTAFFPDYDEAVTPVAAAIVNSEHEQTSDRAIAEALDLPRLLVEHVLDTLESRGLIKCSRMTGPITSVYSVDPRLRRLLQ
jgi:hypothetical protein